MYYQSVPSLQLQLFLTCSPGAKPLTSQPACCPPACFLAEALETAVEAAALPFVASSISFLPGMHLSATAAVVSTALAGRPIAGGVGRRQSPVMGKHGEREKHGGRTWRTRRERKARGADVHSAGEERQETEDGERGKVC